MTINEYPGSLPIDPTPFIPVAPLLPDPTFSPPNAPSVPVPLPNPTAVPARSPLLWIWALIGGFGFILLTVALAPALLHRRRSPHTTAQQ